MHDSVNEVLENDPIKGFLDNISSTIGKTGKQSKNKKVK